MSKKNQITGCKAAVERIRYQSILQQQKGSAFRKYGRSMQDPPSGSTSIRGTTRKYGKKRKVKISGCMAGAEGSDIGETWQQQERVSSLQV